MIPEIALQKLKSLVEALDSGRAEPLDELRLLEHAFTLADEALKRCDGARALTAVFILNEAMSRSSTFKKHARALFDMAVIGDTKRHELERDIDGLKAVGEEGVLLHNAVRLDEEERARARDKGHDA
ncbi:hypothetical protein FXF51_27105 [Nonomuraea sp. PA05]|uniref:hypothetical protein n=1 Tax=Nonomuraea sp. PA05 TaxID=2604466 RepID=UPI0011D72787|nr:hypothetical protein [Nonomuraea sp. PA05]TYB61750.1 hypothetical protein FXF51_27105 [Nonomuraea sp. PA05]